MRKFCIVKKAEDWKWGSAWIRLFGKPRQKKMLSEWLIEISKNYLLYLNEPQGEGDSVSLRISVNKNVPFGDTIWVGKMVDTLNIGQTLRSAGRPKRNGG